MHLDRVNLVKKILFIRSLIKENPKAVFLTGDNSSGRYLYYDLYALATFVKCPIYFVLGNHDYWHSDRDKINQKVNKLINKFPNLVWLSNSEVVSLTPKVALIGDEGWYDGYNGDPKYLKYTLDHLMIKDYRLLPNMDEKIKAFREFSTQSNNRLVEKLNQAIDRGYRTIYILCHFPPWKEATRHPGTIFEKFWLPYDTNIKLGKEIKRIARLHKKTNIIVFTGHTHEPKYVRISKNIMCHIGHPGIDALHYQCIFA